MRVAFLGLGRMGVLMARHVLDAGHELVVWNRTPGRAGDLVAAGAQEAASAEECGRGADAVVLMLFGPDAVREVLPQVLAGGPAPGALVVDATTIGPDDARSFAELCAAAGARYVEAPVAGSVAPAAEGTLGVLAGGPEADVADALPLLHLWGDPARVRRVGDVGAGSAMKLCNNLALGATIAGIGEALRVASATGLDRAAVLDVLAQGPLGWMVGAKRSMLDSSDFSGTTFSVELMAKDLDLALRAGGGDLPVLTALHAAAVDAAGAHGGDDFAVIAAHLEQG